MKECVSIRRELAKANPAAYEPDFAFSLQTLADYFRVARRRGQSRSRSSRNPDPSRRGQSRCVSIDAGQCAGDTWQHLLQRSTPRGSAGRLSPVGRYLSRTCEDRAGRLRTRLAVSLGSLGSDYDDGKRRGGRSQSSRSTGLRGPAFPVVGAKPGSAWWSRRPFFAGMFILAKDFEHAGTVFRQASDMARRLVSLKSSYQPACAATPSPGSHLRSKFPIGQGCSCA